jgi:MFS family permease
VSTLTTSSGLGRYAALFRAPGVGQVVMAGLIGRLPQGMVPLGTVLLVRAEGHSYAIVGLVVAALSLVSAATSPLVGRLVDRIGQARVLLPIGVLNAIALGTFVWLVTAGAPSIVLVVFAALTGATMPPIGACIRTLWPTMLPVQDLRETAFALEAWVQELSFVLGPVVVGALAAAISPAVAMLFAGLLGLVGTTWFALTRPARAQSGHADGESRPRSGALGSRGVRTVIYSCTAVGIAFGVVEVTMPAFAEVHATRAEGALALTCFATGSLIGGIFIGTRAPARRPELRFALMLGLLGAALLPTLLAPSIPVMCGILVFAGMPIAPAFAASYGLVDHLSLPGTDTEAFAWLSTAVVTGISAGTAAGGVVIEHFGTTQSLAIAGPSACIGAAIVMLGRASLAQRPVAPEPQPVA